MTIQEEENPTGQGSHLDTSMSPRAPHCLRGCSWERAPCALQQWDLSQGPAWGCLHSPIHLRVHEARLCRGQEQGEELPLHPELPTAERGLIHATAELARGSYPAPGSKISCRPRQIAGAQDGWGMQQPYGKLVVSMRWTGRGSACLCQGEESGCLPAREGEGRTLGPSVPKE